MARELKPWGGEVHLPRWVGRLFGRRDPADSPERAHERRQPSYPDTTVQENADRAIFGAWSEGHPGNKDPHRR